MISIILGIIFTALTVVFGVEASGLNLQAFFNLPGIIMVFGGTIAIGTLSSRPGLLKMLFKSIHYALFTDSNEVLKADIHNAFAAMRAKKTYHSKHHVLHKMIELYSAGLSREEIIQLSQKEVLAQLVTREDAAYFLKNLSKYPPALGMMGTVFGMVGVFSSMGIEGKQAMMGANMAVAMSATLYGLVFANFCISPITEKLMSKMDIYERQCDMIISSFDLFMRSSSKILVDETIEVYSDAI